MEDPLADPRKIWAVVQTLYPTLCKEVRRNALDPYLPRRLGGAGYVTRRGYDIPISRVCSRISRFAIAGLISGNVPLNYYSSVWATATSGLKSSTVRSLDLSSNEHFRVVRCSFDLEGATAYDNMVSSGWVFLGDLREQEKTLLMSAISQARIDSPLFRTKLNFSLKPLIKSRFDLYLKVRGVLHAISRSRTIRDVLSLLDNPPFEELLFYKILEQPDWRLPNIDFEDDEGPVRELGPLHTSGRIDPDESYRSALPFWVENEVSQKQRARLMRAVVPARWCDTCCRLLEPTTPRSILEYLLQYHS